MGHARILLVADPPAGPRMQEHLSAFATCDLIRYREYHGVPHGTEWVMVMNAEGRGEDIFKDARKAGATPVSIPTGWSHVQQKLERVGFFRRIVKDATLVVVEVPLKQRPFSVLANRQAPPLAPEPEPAPEPPPAPPEPEIAAPVAPPTREEEPMPPTAATQPPAEPAAPMAGAMTTRPFTDEERTRALVASAAARAAATEAKLKTLRLIYEANPDATLRSALDALRTMSLDKRAVGALEAARVRNEVRAAKGLPPIIGPHGYTKPSRTVTEATVAAGLAAAPGKTVETPPAPTPPPAAPPAGGASLPMDVEAASRLLREALEASPNVLDYAFTFKRGERAKIRWRPILDALDAEV